METMTNGFLDLFPKPEFDSIMETFSCPSLQKSSHIKNIWSHRHESAKKTVGQVAYCKRITSQHLFFMGIC